MSLTSCRPTEACPSSLAYRGWRGAIGRLQAWWQARRALRAMLQLDDRFLRDIGLTRQALARHYRRRKFWW